MDDDNDYMPILCIQNQPMQEKITDNNVKQHLDESKTVIIKDGIVQDNKRRDPIPGIIDLIKERKDYPTQKLIEETECFGYGWYLKGQGVCAEFDCCLRFDCEKVYHLANGQTKPKKKDIKEYLKHEKIVQQTESETELDKIFKTLHLKNTLLIGIK